LPRIVSRDITAKDWSFCSESENWLIWLAVTVRV
jgi:hypothetical protein